MGARNCRKLHSALSKFKATELTSPTFRLNLNMKSFVAVALLVAVGVATSAPMDDTSSGAPSSLLSSLRELRSIVHQTLEEIEEVAIADNKEIGRKIENTIAQEVLKIKEQVKQARAQGKLSLEARDQIFTKVVQQMEQVKELLKEDLQQLKPETQETIKGIYMNGIVKAKVIVDGIRSLPLPSA